MPVGYLVSLGGNNALNGGDAISGGTVTFTTQTSLGAGQWTWSGTFGGTTFTNEVEPGQYFVATNGNVYFVPDFGPVDTLSSSTVISSPSFTPIMGTSGGDTLLGTAGANTIYGGSSTSPTGTGNDSINAGGGNDVIFAGDGNDTLQGGSGADTLYGGAGTDTASYSGSGSAVNVNLATGAASGGNAAGDVLNSIEGVTGSGFNDTLTGSSGANIIDGGGGADLIRAGGGNDTVLGGTGNDTIFGEGGNDSIDAGDGNDSVSGGDGNDTILGGIGADTLSGNAGNDSISGGAGNDVIGGITTTNAAVLNWGSGSANGTFAVTGGAGSVNVTTTTNTNVTGATASIQTTGAPAAAGLWVNSIADPITTTMAFDTPVENVTFEIYDLDFSAGGWDDAITITAIDANGNPVTVTFSDLDGVHSVSGNTVNADGSASNGVETTGAIDSVTVSIAGPISGMTIVFDNGESWATSGTFGVGNMNFDIVTTTDEDGDDTIDGGIGNDLITAGSGNDTVLLNDGFGNDTITGGEAGETVGDTLDASGMTSGINITLGADGESGTAVNGANTATFAEIENYELTAFDDVFDASATTTGIAEDGGAGADSMIGGTGADTFSGGSGNDTLSGGAGNDSIDGGIGNDTITGGTGNDTIVGGAGNDTFVYTAGDGADVISDFNTGNTGPLDDGDQTNNDFIDLSSFYDSAAVAAYNAANGANPDIAHAITLLREDLADGKLDGIINGVDIGLDIDLTLTGASGADLSFDNTNVVCFTSGTAIRTPRGDVLIDELKVGDLVTTMDNGPQRIRWIGQRSLGAGELQANPNIRPVLIKRGVLGAERDLLVSPQHGMLIGRNGDLLARAKHLAETVQGVRIAHGRKQVTYIHLMFDDHQVIFAENAPSESFYPGSVAMAALEESARRELHLLFPELGMRTDALPDAAALYGPTARYFAKRRDVIGAGAKLANPDFYRAVA